MDKPILFSTEMVRAILDNRKSQTRRFVKLTEFGLSDTPGYKYHFRDKRLLWNDVNDNLFTKFAPYKVGDRLYVRESFWLVDCPLGGFPYYLFEDEFKLYQDEKWYNSRSLEFWGGREWMGKPSFGHKPSIHMPKEISRISLEVTGVRVERLQDITEEDARAEGVESFIYDGCGVYKDYGGMPYCMSAKESYRTLWESLYGRESWEANPWLFVYEFKRANNGEVH
jgi:hypothetical protein